MELLGNIGLGLQTALSLHNLFYCLIGVFLGTLIGVLPGLGPIATIAMLLTPLPQCTEPQQHVHADLFGPLKTKTRKI